MRSPDTGWVSCLPCNRHAVVSAFAPMADELRVWPLLRRLSGDGVRLALPVMQGKGQPLHIPRMDARRCHGQRRCGALPSRRPTSLRSIPIFC